MEFLNQMPIGGWIVSMIIFTVISIGITNTEKDAVDKFINTKRWNPIIFFKFRISEIKEKYPLMRGYFVFGYSLIFSVVFWPIWIIILIISLRFLKPLIFRKETN